MEAKYDFARKYRDQVLKCSPLRILSGGLPCLWGYLATRL